MAGEQHRSTSLALKITQAALAGATIHNDTHCGSVSLNQFSWRTQKLTPGFERTEIAEKMVCCLVETKQCTQEKCS